MPHQPLDREEYIEQEYFFRVYRERLQQSIPSQEVLQTIGEEILATTRLPMAIDFLRSEILHSGRISEAMRRLSHYFTPFQAFVISRAEADEERFEQLTALKILESEAKYKSSQPSMAGLFVFQFECIARNRLGYSDGLEAMAADSMYDDRFGAWIRRMRFELGSRDLADVIYQASQNYVSRRTSQNSQPAADSPESSSQALFGDQEGRIARANIGREPLYLLAALQRQLGYPVVPRVSIADDTEKLPGFLEARLARMEQRLKLLEMESRGGIDLSRFYRQAVDEQTGRPDFGALDP